MERLWWRDVHNDWRRGWRSRRTCLFTGGSLFVGVVHREQEAKGSEHISDKHSLRCGVRPPGVFSDCLVNVGPHACNIGAKIGELMAQFRHVHLRCQSWNSIFEFSDSLFMVHGAIIAAAAATVKCQLSENHTKSSAGKVPIT